MNYQKKLNILENILLHLNNDEIRPSIKQYFDNYIKYGRKYGKKICLLYQQGSFYEFYSVPYIINNETIVFGNAEEIANILNMHYGRQNRRKELSFKNAMISGFPINSSLKNNYINELISNNYIVIILKQVQEPYPDPKSRLGIRYVRGILDQIIIPTS